MVPRRFQGGSSVFVIIRRGVTSYRVRGVTSYRVRGVTMPIGYRVGCGAKAGHWERDA